MDTTQLGMPTMPIVVITGAGAGHATVEGFARHGYAVGLLGRDKDRLERAASDIRDRHGARALPIPKDAADAEAVETAADRVAPGLVERYGAKASHAGQPTDRRELAGAPASMSEPVPGDRGAHGRFDNRARSGSWECPPAGIAPPSSPPRRSRCRTRLPNGWISERLR